MTTKLGILVGALLVAGLALLPTPAGAKGATDAKITGLWLDSPIRLGSGGAAAATGQVGASELGEAAGLYAAVFSRTAAAVESERPERRLGEQYVVTYRFVVGQDENLEYRYERVRQELYPFARGGAVSYTPGDQRVFGEPAPEGWYRAGPELRDLLVAAGVPEPRRS